MKIRTAAGKALLALALLLLPPGSGAQEQPGPPDTPEGAARPDRGPRGADQNAMYAREEFRLGVQAYNRFSFNAAIG
ncbi:MAG: hypothetical protein LBH15_03960, partial [Treponema sp.]|nr:hypothetical protein [Treponema sp.]